MNEPQTIPDQIALVMTAAITGRLITIVGVDRLWRSDSQLDDDIVYPWEGKFQSTQVGSKCILFYLFTLRVLTT